MKIFYLLNGFSNGGAELGLATMVEKGFFEGTELLICALVRDDGWAGERLSDKLGSDRVCHLFEGNSVSGMTMLRALPRIFQMLAKFKPDLMILSLPQANIVGRLVATCYPKLKVVAFEHSEFHRRNITGPLLKLTAGRIDAVLYDDPETWAAMRRFHRRLPDRSHFQVPLTMLDVRGSVPDWPDGRVRMLTIGRLCAVKNHADLIKAVRLLVDRGYDISLDIAGNGPLHDELEGLVHRLGLTDRVRLLGFRRDCRSLRQTSDIYVQSSSHEGLCISVLEAMAEGMLVVSTDVGGMRRYGIDGYNMIKAVTVGPEHLAGALIRALDNPGGNKQIREAALRTIQEGFTQQAVQKLWSVARSGLSISPASEMTAAFND